MNKEKIHQALVILDDVLSELNHEESNRPTGQGISSEEYVLGQIEKVFYMLRDEELKLNAKAVAKVSPAHSLNKKGGKDGTG